MALPVTTTRNMTADPCHTALLRQAVDASGDVVFITDTDRVFTYVNQQFAKVDGYAAEDVVGRATPRIAADRRERPHAAVARIQPAAAVAAQDGRPQRCG